MRRNRPKPIKKTKKTGLGKRFGFKYTIMLVPHSEKKPIHIKIPVAVFVALFILLTGLLSCTTYFAYSSWRLQAVETENAGLKKITDEQEAQLNRLEELADEVLSAARSAGELENEVRESIGLETEESILPAYGGPFVEYSTHGVYDAGDAEIDDKIRRTYAQLSALIDFYRDYASSVTALGEAADSFLDSKERYPDLWPIADGRYHVTSEYGTRIDPFNLMLANHSALDISSPLGTPVLASGRGVVITAKNFVTGYGNCVMIDHGNGYVTLYAHCSTLLVKAGDAVEKGDVIALVGATGRATGYHLHFGVKYDGSFINPRRVLS